MPKSCVALAAERMTRHGLVAPELRSPRAATSLTTAIQAQDAAAARLGIRARAAGSSDADVRAAIEDDRSIVRTWLMRGTIHLVPAEDLRWLVRLIAPSVARRYRTRWRQIGLTDDLLDRVAALLPEILADGPLPRAAIRTGLAERGIVLPDGDPPAPTHALVYASTCGLICRGPDLGRDATFTLLDRWLPGTPAGPDGDDALAELARRYFRAYSPATAADFAAWSGLPTGRALDLIRDELTSTDVDGRPGFRLGEVPPARGVRLLPAFDNYVIGYRDRAALLAEPLHGHVYHGGMIRPTVVVDGRVVATWSLDRSKGRVVISAFAPLTAALRRAVETEVADVGRFLDRELTVTLAPA